MFCCRAEFSETLNRIERRARLIDQNDLWVQLSCLFSISDLYLLEGTTLRPGRNAWLYQSVSTLAKIFTLGVSESRFAGKLVDARSRALGPLAQPDGCALRA